MTLWNLFITVLIALFLIIGTLCLYAAFTASPSTSEQSLHNLSLFALACFAAALSMTVLYERRAKA